MDAANAALATHLADRGSKVHLVCHRADEDLRKHKMVEVHRVERPAGSFFLGQWLINSSGRRVARAVLAHDASARVVVNGGNCNWPDINWVHYVHRAWREMDSGGSATVARKAAARQIRRAGPRKTRARSRAGSNCQFKSYPPRFDQSVGHSRRTRAHGLSRQRTALAVQTPERRLSAREWLNKPADRPIGGVHRISRIRLAKGFRHPVGSVAKALRSAPNGMSIWSWQAEVARCRRGRLASPKRAWEVAYRCSGTRTAFMTSLRRPTCS